MRDSLSMDRSRTNFWLSHRRHSALLLAIPGHFFALMVLLQVVEGDANLRRSLKSHLAPHE